MSIRNQFIQIASQTKQLLQNTKTMISLSAKAKENGKLTARDEILLVTKTKQDLFKLVPSLLYICLPFTIPTIPVIIKFFPNLLPEFIQTEHMKQQKIKTLMETRTKTSTKFINQLIINLNDFKSSDSKMLFQRTLLLELLKKEKISLMDFYSCADFINDYLNVCVLDSKLVSLFYEFNGWKFGVFKREKLLKEADWILKDDELIRDYGINRLTRDEIIDCLMARNGVFTNDLSRIELNRELKTLIEFERGLKSKFNLFGFTTVFYLNRIHKVINKTT
jgi:hypothetical protein